MNRKHRTAAFLLAAASLFLATPVEGALKAPDYYQCRLDSIFPAGGQQGTSVTVELRGRNSGLASPKHIIIDGPPGITVNELKSASKNNAVQARFTIAPDAPPGRRWVRVASGQSGLTNFAHFVVSALPEHVEQEKSNDSLDSGEEVNQPVVVNGRINPKADIDCYRFSAKKDEQLVVAIAAHALDIHGYGGNYGMADFSLELLDEQGRVVAESLDALGYDPLIEFKVPSAGEYTARVKLVAHNGFPEAVYRLTIGEVPYVTSIFPASLQRGKETEVELHGPNVPPKTRRKISTHSTAPYPVDYVTMPGASSGQDVRVYRSHDNESIEIEPNDESALANELAYGRSINGRFNAKGDADWYRIRVEDKQQVWLQVFAHRFIRSPVDTLLEVYDGDGKQLAENDDDRSTDPGFASYHDFHTTDSGLLFRPERAGEYFVRVTDNNGGHGPRAVYRLAMSRYAGTPEFQLRHYPDAVPIWGPGSTAALQVRVDRIAYMKKDIALSIEGLPKGWKGSTAVALGVTNERPKNPHKDRIFLTITAPADAEVGTVVPFRVVGRVETEGRTIERVSWPLTWFYTSDTGFFRITQQARAAVANPNGPWLEATIDELTIKQGEETSIPVRIHGAENLKEIPLVVNLAESIKCNLGTPTTVPINDGIARVPLVDTARLPIGTFAITVAQTWRSDIRVGMPGPCTSIIKLRVRSK